MKEKSCFDEPVLSIRALTTRVALGDKTGDSAVIEYVGSRPKTFCTGLKPG